MLVWFNRDTSLVRTLSLASIASVLANGTVLDNAKRKTSCYNGLGHNFISLVHGFNFFALVNS